MKTEAIMIVCVRCRGRNSILCLGNLVKKCPECKGIGFTKVVEEVKEPVTVDVIKEPVKSKKQKDE